MPASSARSPELALLAACGLDSATDLAARAELVARHPFDWARFERLALDHGLAGMAGERLNAVAPGLLPSDQAETLRRTLQHDALRQIAQTAETARLCGAIAAAGAEAMVMKGVGLAHLLYPEQPAWRSSSDIDLLIDAEALPAADRALRAAGYARTSPVADPPSGSAGRMALHLDNVFDYVHPASGQLVELHHRLTRNPHWVPCPFAALRAAASPVETRWGRFLALDGPANLAYLCWHALGHYRFLLKWICDIARALDRAGATSCAALVTAQQPAISPHPAALVDALLACIAGKGDAAGDARSRQAADRIAARMEDPAAFPTARSFARLPGEIANELFLMRLADSWPGRAYQLLNLLADPRDARVLKLGPRWAPVYALLGPLLSVARYLRRPTSA
jgi:hypothetical protein